MDSLLFILADSSDAQSAKMKELPVMPVRVEAIDGAKLKR